MRTPLHVLKTVGWFLFFYCVSVLVIFLISYLLFLCFRQQVPNRLWISFFVSVEICSIVLGSLLCVFALDRIRRRMERSRIRRRLMRREDLPDAEFLSSVPCIHPSTILIVRALVAKYLNVPRTKLRAEDNFVVDMGPCAAREIVPFVISSYPCQPAHAHQALNISDAITVGTIAGWIDATRMRSKGNAPDDAGLSDVEREWLQQAHIAHARVLDSDTGALPNTWLGRIVLGLFCIPLFATACFWLYRLWQWPRPANWKNWILLTMADCFLASAVFATLYGLVWAIATPRWILRRAHRAMTRFYVLYIAMIITVAILFLF